MSTQSQGAFAHNPDVNPDWSPKLAYRKYACVDCGRSQSLQTNHTGHVYDVRCYGRCRNVINPNTANEQVRPAYTVHRYVEEQ